MFGLGKVVEMEAPQFPVSMPSESLIFEHLQTGGGHCTHSSGVGTLRWSSQELSDDGYARAPPPKDPHASKDPPSSVATGTPCPE